jgi:deoxyribose-phosphate aldolase
MDANEAAALTPRTIAAFIDHTLLAPEAQPARIEALCAESVRHGFFGVCVNPCHLPRVVRLLAGQSPVPIAAVGFPLGATLARVKAYEAGECASIGAREIDMVLNLAWLKAGDREAVVRDIAAVVRAAAPLPVKVILETCLLSEEEKIQACWLAFEAGAAFVKTSTGFAKGGAELEDVRLLRRCVDEISGGVMGVKASGGIKSFAQAKALIEAGASRIGASASLRIVGGKE